MEEKKQVETKEQLLQRIEGLQRTIMSLNNALESKEDKILEQSYYIDILKNERDKYQLLYAAIFKDYRKLEQNFNQKEGR